MTTYSQRLVHGASYILISAFAAVAGALPVEAAILNVGPGQPYANPSAAVAVAQAGDTIQIAPGTYNDCAVIQVNNVTIQGSNTDIGTGPGTDTIMSNKVCWGKGILVVYGSGITVRNIRLEGAVDGDGNGAGIRAEGNSLTVDGVTFHNNQDGILTDNIAQATLTVTGSGFWHNGTCVSSSGCAHGIYAGHIASLTVERSRFINTQVGHHIKSRALKTVVTGCRIEDGPNGTASYELDVPNGGDVTMNNNTIEKGPNNGNHTAAISIGEEGVSQATHRLNFANDKFTNDGPPTTFVNNLTSTSAILTGDTFTGSVTPLNGPGTVH